MTRMRSKVAVVAVLSLVVIIGAPAAAQTDEATADTDAVEVTGVDYAYEGLPTSLPSGAILAFGNAGSELHELAVVRVADDTTESLEELMAMGDAALEQGKVEQVGEAGPLIANPGEAAEGTLTLEQEGRYIAICLIPQGFVPGTLADLGVTPDMLGPDADPEDLPPEVQAILANPPHAAFGMVQEFTVTAVGTEPGPLPETEPALEGESATLEESAAHYQDIAAIFNKKAAALDKRKVTNLARAKKWAKGYQQATAGFIADIRAWPWPEEVADEVAAVIAQRQDQRDLWAKMSRAKTMKALLRLDKQQAKLTLPSAKGAAAMTEALGLPLSDRLREYLEANDG